MGGHLNIPCVGAKHAVSLFRRLDKPHFAYPGEKAMPASPL